MYLSVTLNADSSQERSPTSTSYGPPKVHAMARCLGQLWSLLLSDVRQSLFWEQASGTPPKARETLRLQTFVDDPLFCIRGSQQARARKMALVVLVWGALGFPLSFHKVARGSSVPWVGCVLKVDVLALQVTAEIAEEKVVEAKDRTEQILRSNVVSEEELRSILGLLRHLSSLIFPMRAFLSPLWAALPDSFSRGAIVLFVEAAVALRLGEAVPTRAVMDQGLPGPGTKETRAHVHCSGIPEQWPTYTSGHRRQSMRTGRHAGGVRCDRFVVLRAPHRVRRHLTSNVRSVTRRDSRNYGKLWPCWWLSGSGEVRGWEQGWSSK